MLYPTVTPDLARDQVVFVHIRKTAGTALAQVMAEGLGAETPMRTHWGSAAREERGLLALHGPLRRAAINAGESAAIAWRRLRGLPVHLAEDQPFFAAHMLLGEAPRGPRRPLYLTVLRDPAERFLSDYVFMRSKRDRARADALDHALYDLELPEFVAAIERRPEAYLHDYQCRQLAGGRPDLGEATRAVDERLWLAAAVPQMGAMLEKAGAALGVRFPPLPVVRRTAGRLAPSDLDPGLLARLRALNAGDASLVAHAAEAFDRL